MRELPRSATKSLKQAAHLSKRSRNTELLKQGLPQSIARGDENKRTWTGVTARRRRRRRRLAQIETTQERVCHCEVEKTLVWKNWPKMQGDFALQPVFMPGCCCEYLE
eukprot:4199224-Amphidinium_carterae.1